MSLGKQVMPQWYLWQILCNFLCMSCYCAPSSPNLVNYSINLNIPSALSPIYDFSSISLTEAWSWGGITPSLITNAKHLINQILVFWFYYWVRLLKVIIVSGQEFAFWSTTKRMKICWAPPRTLENSISSTRPMVFFIGLSCRGLLGWMIKSLIFIMVCLVTEDIKIIILC